MASFAFNGRLVLFWGGGGWRWVALLKNTFLFATTQPFIPLNWVPSNQLEKVAKCLRRTSRDISSTWFWWYQHAQLTHAKIWSWNLLISCVQEMFRISKKLGGFNTLTFIQNASPATFFDMTVLGISSNCIFSFSYWAPPYLFYVLLVTVSQIGNTISIWRNSRAAH